MSLAVLTTAGETRSFVHAAKQRGQRIALVPTMGALHAGHASLFRLARTQAAVVIATIFVNPTQFGPNEDFARYPRTLEADLELAQESQVDAVFVPDTATMYPPPATTFVDVGELGTLWEGAIRPGHFRGVATVVLKLFNVVQPDLAVFGQKDFQQCQVIRRMVSDLLLPVELRIGPTVREPDGLAMSSRNRYLSPDERQQAVVLSQALLAAKALADGGERARDRLVAAMHHEMGRASLARVDYIDVVENDTLSAIARAPGPATAIVAARFGSTRLIDNLPLWD